MQKEDWIGLGTSLGFHLLLLLAFAFMTVASKQTPVGFVEVEFGEIQTGRPTERTVRQQAEQIPMEPTEEPQEEPQKQDQAEEASSPVDLPEQETRQDDETIDEPEQEEEIATEAEPEQQQPQDSAAVAEAQQQPQPSGEQSATPASGAENTTPGSGDDQARTAPFSLEGIDRVPQRTPLPDYSANVNAVIQVAITVAPDGDISRMIIKRRGHPELDQAVLRALRSWQFNPLPPGAPQEEQRGTITFRFQLQ